MSEKTEQLGEAWAFGHYTEWCGGQVKGWEKGLSR